MAPTPSSVPERPKIYHITHVRNLETIVSDGVLWSDAQRIARGLDCEVVGMSAIKKRRLEERPVHCCPGTMVGEYVPFYFCPRSIMLYLLHMGNHPELTYREGQEPIVHLQADLYETVAWAQSMGQKWAFSNGNAGTYYTRFYAQVDQLGQVNWQAVEALDWRPAQIKEGKQAEFLVYDSFPWSLVERIGVQNPSTAKLAEATVEQGNHRPPITVEVPWYY